MPRKMLKIGLADHMRLVTCLVAKIMAGPAFAGVPEEKRRTFGADIERELRAHPETLWTLDERGRTVPSVPIPPGFWLI